MQQSAIATLSGDHARVFLLVDAYTSRGKLRDDLAALRPGPTETVHAIVDDLVRRGFVVEIGDRLVGTIPLRRRRSSAELTAWLQRWVGESAAVPATAPDALAALAAR
jgi:hypothetical protein